MNRSMTIGDINLDLGSISLGHMLLMTVAGLSFRYFKLATALLIAALPKKYAKRVLNIFKQLNDSSTTTEGGDNQSGTPRRRKSLKRT